MEITQRNVRPAEAGDDVVHAHPVGRRGFMKGVGAGLGVGVLALTSIGGAQSAAAAYHSGHCSSQAKKTYTKMVDCWCNEATARIRCKWAKFCVACRMSCTVWYENYGCC